MIEPQELRIGNYVLPERCKLPYLTVGIFRGVHLQTPNGKVAGEYDFKQVNPIPLTPELLDRLGFEKYDVNGYKMQITNGRMLIVVNNHVHMRDIIEKTTSVELTTCKYIHQIQNLYFALTGQELELKPQKHDTDHLKQTSPKTEP